MKKLLLVPLVAIGLALVPAKQADAQVSIGVGGVGVGFGYPAYRYGYYGYPGYNGYYPRGYYNYYGGYLITEHTITTGRRITGSIVTIATIIIITATKADGLV